MEPVTISVADATKALGLGQTKIWQLIGAGRLQTVKIGRRTLIKTDSIRALVDQVA